MTIANPIPELLQLALSAVIVLVSIALPLVVAFAGISSLISQAVKR